MITSVFYDAFVRVQCIRKKDNLILKLDNFGKTNISNMVD